MKAAELYSLLNTVFGELVCTHLDKGRSFFLQEVKSGPASTRIIRVSEKSDGSIEEVKLSVSSRLSGELEKMNPPFSREEILEVVANEISLLKSRLKFLGQK